MRIVKILGFSLLGLLALLVLAVVAIVILVDPNDFKEEISQVVKNHTGRELNLEGDLGLSFFPWLALNVKQAELGNAEGFGPEPFALIREADVGVKLFPLLRKELQVGRVRLEGLQLNLSVDETGRSNWEDLAGEEPAESPPEAGGAVPQTSIAGLEIRDAALRYRDAKEGSEIRLENLNLRTDRISPGEPMDVQLEFNLFQGEDAKAIPVALSLADLRLDLDQQTLQAPEFTLAIPPAKVRGQITASSIIDAPFFEGRMSLEPLSPRELFKTLGLDAPVTRDASVLNALALDAAFQASTDSLVLSDLNMRLDDTGMSGSLGIADFQTNALRFDLNIDRLNVDRYLPPAEEENEEPGEGEPIELPMDLLRELNAQGALQIDELTLAGVKLAAVKLKVDAKDGMVRVDPSEAQLYEGAHRGVVSIDARKDVARLSFDEKLSGIAFAPLFQDLFERALLSGKGNLSASLTATGNDSTAWVKTLNGKMNFTVAEGAVEGMDLWYEIRRAQALFKRQASPAEGSRGRTPFNALQASATVTNGTMHNPDLTIDMQYLNVTGKGTLELPTKKVDYQLNTTVYEVPASGEGAELADLKSVQIPVRISGTLDDLSVRPDLQARVKAEAEKKIEEKKEELKEKLEKELGKWLLK